MTQPLVAPLFEIVTTTAGAISIRNNVVNEIMHNPVGPWVEANSLYIEQSDLRRRLLEQRNEELVVFDVGLGAAANSLAAMACVRELGDQARPFRIVSFEKDLELLRFAIANATHFHHFAGYETILADLLEKKFWSNGRITWELRHGDFLELIANEPQKAHVIFYDPYSPKMNEDMWTTDCFRLLRAKSRAPAEGGTVLYTYSRATRIRVSMIAAGFYVGFGSATGLKNETTEASTDYRQLKNPASEIWFDRWKRSHMRHPFDCKTPEQMSQIDQVVETYMADIATLTSDSSVS
jgi:tRNA U34 5-methylaminomethyl-2-thiouridine-forming methyltransferase MnmC